MSKVVYILDDDETALFITKRAIKSVDNTLEIKTFNSSVDLLNKLSNKELEFPDLFICDINMPGLTGFEFFEKIKTLDHFKKGLPFYIQSTSVREEDLAMVHNSPDYHGHFEKYMKGDQIRNALQKLVA